MYTQYFVNLQPLNLKGLWTIISGPQDHRTRHFPQWHLKRTHDNLRLLF